jgi:hypothetical protein
VSGYNNQSSSYDDDMDRQDGTTGGGLRKALEDALAKLEKAQKDLEDYRRGDTAESVLKDKGLDPALKDLIPADTDPKDWVEKYAHLLGTKPAAKAEEKDSNDDPEFVALEEEDPAITLEREARERINAAADSGSPAHLTGDVLQRMDKINSEDELMEFFRSNGAPSGG